MPTTVKPAVTDPLGNTSTTAYDADGNVTSITDPLGHTTTYQYDRLNRQTSMTDPLGHTCRPRVRRGR